MSELKMKKGFTLVEFLIVIGILSLSVGSLMLILTTVVKGVNQVNVNAEVKQNGQNVLDTISGLVRGATDVYKLDGQLIFGVAAPLPTGAESAIWVWTTSGEKMTIACVDFVAGTANGKIMVKSDPSSSTTPPATLTGFEAISNTDLTTGVDIECNPSGNAFNVSTVGTVKVVLVDFKVKQAINAPSRVDFKASADFQTAISLRQYQ